jgi:outer membrane protein assembly factor BamE (lipoprotein component of BamABCDE complex)
MRKLFIFIILSLFISACTLNKVKNHHGVHFLDKKEKQLTINKSNKNDILKLLGPPIVQKKIDNDLFVYVERIATSTHIHNLGSKKVTTNNILLLEINNRGILINKKFADISKMNDLEIEKKFTVENYSKKNFIYKLLSSLRSKINDPLGKKRMKSN